MLCDYLSTCVISFGLFVIWCLYCVVHLFCVFLCIYSTGILVCYCLSPLIVPGMFDEWNMLYFSIRNLSVKNILTCCITTCLKD